MTYEFKSVPNVVSVKRDRTGMRSKRLVAGRRKLKYLEEGLFFVFVRALERRLNLYER